jgi:hypothetical protein
MRNKIPPDIRSNVELNSDQSLENPTMTFPRRPTIVAIDEARMRKMEERRKILGYTTSSYEFAMQQVLDSPMLSAAMHPIGPSRGLARRDIVLKRALCHRPEYIIH